MEDFPPHDALYGDLDFRTHLYKIADRLRTMARPAKELFDDLIPAPVPTGSTEVGAADCPVNVQLATLYVALHPLFTSSHLLEPSTGPDRLPIPDDVNDNSHTDLSSLSLFRIIATSASIVIDHYSWLNETGRILSLWMAAERVLEAGAIWAFHVVRQRALSVSSSAWERAAVERRAAMAPLLKVSTLLASFAARWKPGSAYSDAWEALVELIWTML